MALLADRMRYADTAFGVCDRLSKIEEVFSLSIGYTLHAGTF